MFFDCSMSDNMLIGVQVGICDCEVSPMANTKPDPSYSGEGEGMERGGGMKGGRGMEGEERLKGEELGLSYSIIMQL